MSTRAWSAEYRSTTVCIDSYENTVPVGRFYNSYLNHARAFRGLTQFLSQMEQALDTMDFPRAFTARRSFAQPPLHAVPSPEEPVQKGERATFIVKVLFRRNASWQGVVTWQEGRLEQGFRSVLELILLMDSVMREQEQASVFKSKSN